MPGLAGIRPAMVTPKNTPAGLFAHSGFARWVLGAEPKQALGEALSAAGTLSLICTMAAGGTLDPRGICEHPGYYIKSFGES